MIPHQHRRPAHRTRPSDGDGEYGDWRVPPSSPQVSSRSMLQQAHERVRQLENATSYGALFRHSVSVTHTADEPPTYEYDETDPPIEKIHGWRRIIRMLIALLLLLPLSITMVHALALQLYHALPATAANSSFWLSDPIYFTILGIFTFIALIIAKFATPILVYVYVLGHELTHALAALTCLGRISSVSIDLDGGYIETDKDNAYIALAPYFVPLWMLVWVLLAWSVGLFMDEEVITPWFFGGAGFWWSFHLYWTIWVIPREQPDLLENGVTFSLLVVIIANIAGIILLLRFFNFISLRGYWSDFQTCAADLYDTLAWLISLCSG